MKRNSGRGSVQPFVDNDSEDSDSRSRSGSGNKNSCVQVLLVICNVLLLLIGGAILALGAYLIHIDPLKEYVEEGYYQVLVVGIILVVLGGVCFITAFFGCIGACAKSKCLLITVIILLVLWIFAFLAALAFTVFIRLGYDEYKGDIESTMTDALKVYGNPAVEESDIAKSLWDFFQLRMECCGIESEDDWVEMNQIFAAGEGQFFPESCCVRGSDGETESQCTRKIPDDSYYTTGCYEKSFEYVNDVTTVFIVLFSVGAFVMIISIILSCVLSCCRK